MSYDEVPAVAILGETDDGLPEVVQFEYGSGRTVTATYRGVRDRGLNGEEVIYDVSGYGIPVTMPHDAVQDMYDVIKRIGEREGYQDTPELVDVDALDPVTALDDSSDDTRTVDEILDDDSLDPLF